MSKPKRTDLQAATELSSELLDIDVQFTRLSREERLGDKGEKLRQRKTEVIENYFSEETEG